jgi:hypothetical protein
MRIPTTRIIHHCTHLLLLLTTLEKIIFSARWGVIFMRNYPDKTERSKNEKRLEKQNSKNAVLDIDNGSCRISR